MPAEDDQLFAALEAVRAKAGDGVLADPGHLAAMLNAEDPALRHPIRALVAALATGVPALVRAGGPAAASEAAARIAAETVVTPAQAMTGVNVALRAMAGGVGAAPLPEAAAATEWVGVSTPVGVAAASAVPGAAPAPAVPFIQRHKWLVAAVGLVAVLGGVRTMYQGAYPDAAPAPTPAVQAPAPGPAPGQRAGGAPMLVKTGDLPVIPVQTTNDATVLVFAVPIPGGSLNGAIMVAPGWERGKVAFGHTGDQEPQTVSEVAPFELVRENSGPVRLLTPKWTQDRASAGPICVAFLGPQAPDVQLHGSKLCLIEMVDNKCAKLIGCGQVG